MPYEPPIQNLDKLDIIGHRQDGGVDLIIVVSGVLDASPTTLDLLERKIRNYVSEVGSAEFAAKYGGLAGPSSICVVSEFAVEQAALDTIERLKTVAASVGANLEFRKSMA